MDDPLVGFSPSTRCFPKSPPTASRPKAPLLGFRRPYSASGGESPRPPGHPGRLPGGAGNLPEGPTLPATVPLAGFHNLSAAFILSPPSRHFQAGYARGVCPSGGCSFHEAPPTRRRRHTLLTFLPRVARPPFLGGGIRGRADRLPRIRRHNAFHRLQGLQLRWKSVRIIQPLLMSE